MFNSEYLNKLIRKCNSVSVYKYDDDENRAAAQTDKNKLMKNLHRAMTFQNHPHLSPGRDPKLPPRLSDAYKNRGFSGPLMSLVPIEARGHNNKKGKEKDGGKRDGGGFDSDVEEPRSPKVSCIGQIKQKKKLRELKKAKSKKTERLESKPVATVAKSGGFGNIFRRRSKPHTAEKVAAPGLSQVKRFSGRRDAFANFDWAKQQVAPADRECYSDDEEQRRGDWDEEEEDFGGGGGGLSDVMIPFSAPMLIGGGDVMQLEPRKEICLWKKRNMAPPKPLKLNSFTR